jgi:protein-disulfide isomerase
VSRTPPRQATRRERRAAERLDRPVRTRPSRARGQTPAWRSPMLLITAAAVIVGAVLIALALPKGTAPGADLRIPPTSYPADLVDGANLGPADAPVVMDLYADFQCPACKVFVTNQLPGLVNDFVKAGTLRIVTHDIDIIGRGSPNESVELAAGAYCAAQQGRYWQFHDLVFWNQGRENLGDHNAAFITAVADNSGVDMTAWNACFASGAARQPVDQATSAALAAGINQTPTLVINGQTIAGVPDYTTLTNVIRAAAGETPAPS